MSLRWTHTSRAAAGAWPAPGVWRRPDGVTSVAAGAWLTGGTGPVTVVLEGTVLHPSAPDAAWSPLASWTLGPEAPVATSGLAPLVVALVRFVRWRLASTPEAAPPGAALSLTLEPQD